MVVDQNEANASPIQRTTGVLRKENENVFVAKLFGTFPSAKRCFSRICRPGFSQVELARLLWAVSVLIVSDKMKSDVPLWSDLPPGLTKEDLKALPEKMRALAEVI